MSISRALWSRLQLSKRTSLYAAFVGVVVFSLAGPSPSRAADADAQAEPPGPPCCAAKQAKSCLPTAINALETPAETRSRAAIEAALDSRTEIKVVETPLQDVIDHLKKYHSIEIQIDVKALSDVGITPDERITRDLKGISLRSALRLMLRDLDLTYIICDEVLLITTPEEANGRLTVRLYPVGDLLAAGDSGGAFPADGKALIGMITATIFPTTWEAVGGPASIIGVSCGGVETLVVAQTDCGHDALAAVLASLRRLAESHR